MKKQIVLFLLIMGLGTFFTGCDKTVVSTDGEPVSDYGEKDFYGRGEGDAAQEFNLCKGADVSWLTEMEAKGVKFYSADGKAGDCMNILQALDMNAFRFRVWVNPTDKYNTLDDVIVKAKRTVALGMDVMIDFHYSDTWADPSAQTVPAAWKDLDLDGLVQKVGEYTEESCKRLKEEGIIPKWIQVGNETGNGMLFPYGQADKNPTGYARLNNAGYDAVKKVFPDCKVIVHIQNGQDSSLANWLFSLLNKNGGKWDVCGFSLYPEKSDYSEYVSKAIITMKQCISKLDKDVMLCEVGMGNSYVSECEDFLTQCFKIGEQIEGDRFLGVMYWEPQCYNGWNGYHKGAFTTQGRPSKALDAYKAAGSGIKPVYAD